VRVPDDKVVELGGPKDAPCNQPRAEPENYMIFVFPGAIVCLDPEVLRDTLIVGRGLDVDVIQHEFQDGAGKVRPFQHIRRHHERPVAPPVSKHANDFELWPEIQASQFNKLNAVPTALPAGDAVNGLHASLSVMTICVNSNVCEDNDSD
jgi:hypothetical protein